MDPLVLLLLIIVLMTVGAFPVWPHSRDWGYYPSSGAGLLVIVLVLVMLFGRPI